MKTLKSKTEKKNKTRKESLKEVKLKSISEDVIISDMERPNQRQYWELVDKYYQLKSKYEKETKKLVENLVKDVNLKENVKRLVPPCVNCRRNVGSIFKVVCSKIDSTRGRIHSVRCGDPVTPCSLNISFMIPNINNFNNIFDLDRRRIKRCKIDIIFCKNDLIFQYINEDAVMQKFDIIKEKLNNLLNDNAYSLDMYSMVTTPQEIKDQTESISEYKRLVDEYKKTNAHGFLRDAIQLYISEIHPVGKQNMKNKYQQNNVETLDEYRLIQKETSVSYLETIGRFPLIYEDLNPFIISHDESKGKEPYLKKTSKKIIIIPATEAQSQEVEE